MDIIWYSQLKRSKLTPPDWVFRPAWAVLYFLMGVSVTVFSIGGDYGIKSPGFIIFAMQLGLNLIWPVIFFQKHKILLAFIDIILLLIFICFNIVLFWQHSKLAAVLLLPYLLWIIFATFLNFEILRLNKN